MRATPGVASIRILFFLALLAPGVIAAPAAADSCICFPVYSPTVIHQGTTITFQVTVGNNYNRTIPVTGYLVIKYAGNPAGPVVSYATASATMPPVSNQTLVIPILNITPGSYIAIFYAISTDGNVGSSTVTVSFGLPGSSSPILGGMGVFTLATAPVYCAGGGSRCYQITYLNNMNSTVTGVVFLVIHNSIGQTVQYSTSTINVPAGKTVTAYNVLFGLASGTYNATIFATSTAGTAISSPTTVVFTLA